MLGAIATLPRQLTAGHAAAQAVLREPRRRRAPSSAVLICGMGGSAIGGDLVLAALPELAVPAAVVRGYRLPAWIGPATLVVAASYSGDTEETLACATQALGAARAPVVCVASGGRLAAFAEAHGPAAHHGARRRTAARRGGLPGHAAARGPDLGRPVRRRRRTTWPRPRRCCARATTPTRAVGDEANRAKELAHAPARAAGGRVRRRPHGAGGAPLEGPDQRERQGAGLLQRAARAGPQRADGLDEPAARGRGQRRRASRRRAQEDPRLLRRAELTAAGPRRARRGRGAGHGAGRLAPRRGCSRSSSSATTSSFYLALLYGVDPSTGGRHPGASRPSWPVARRAVTGGAPPALVIVADEPGGAARRRRCCSPGRAPGAGRVTSCARPRPFAGPLFERLADAAGAGRAVSSRWSCPWCPRCRRLRRPARARAGAARRRRPREPGAARPAHRPLAGGRAAQLPGHEPAYINRRAVRAARCASGILVRRRDGGRRRRRPAHAFEAGVSPRAGPARVSDSPGAARHRQPRTTASRSAACGVPAVPTINDEE